MYKQIYASLWKRFHNEGRKDLPPKKHPTRKDFDPDAAPAMLEAAKKEFERLTEAREAWEGFQCVELILQLEEFLARPPKAKLLDGERFEEQEKLKEGIMTLARAVRLWEMQTTPGYNPAPAEFPKDTRTPGGSPENMVKTIKRCLREGTLDMEISKAQLQVAADCWWWLWKHNIPGKVVEIQVTGQGMDTFYWTPSTWEGIVQKLWGEKHPGTLFPRDLVREYAETREEIAQGFEHDVQLLGLKKGGSLINIVERFNTLTNKREFKALPTLHAQEAKLRRWLTAAHKWSQLPSPEFPITPCVFEGNKTQILHESIAYIEPCFDFYERKKDLDFVPEYGKRILFLLQLILAIRSEQ